MCVNESNRLQYLRLKGNSMLWKPNPRLTSMDGWCCFSLLRFKSNSKLLLGISQTKSSQTGHLTETVMMPYMDFSPAAPFLSSCHGDVKVANDAAWALASVVCMTSSPPMRELYQWTSVRCLYPVVYLTDCGLKVSEVPTVAAMSTVPVFIPGVKWCWQIKILLFGYLKSVLYLWHYRHK